MNFQPGKTALDYLIIGHITRDIVEDEFRLGGTAVYSAITARRMGLEVGLVTSFNEDFPVEALDGIQIINHRSERTTTFKNLYTPIGREQYILEKAEPLGMNQIPEDWLTAKIIHLGAVAREIDPETGINFPDSAVCISLQGWLRKWDENGFVQPSPFPKVTKVFTENTSAFLSIEDLGFDRTQLDHLLSLFPMLVLTKGTDGAEIFWEDQISTISVEPREELDPTGAGDIFAAAFMNYYAIEGKSIEKSPRMATALAAISVIRPGIEGIPTEAEIQLNQKVY
ncbi:MAG: PfkB family carbohydrate kinase [Anaerolineales bacterium]|nr:PfkB family carbohydrate kinase [Anaerolineales bacterium]